MMPEKKKFHIKTLEQCVIGSNFTGETNSFIENRLLHRGSLNVLSFSISLTFGMPRLSTITFRMQTFFCMALWHYAVI